MRGHGLMQAIARVNRVFQDKPAGLVVDYIGVAQNLKNALGQYSAADQNNAGIDEADAVAMMLEKYDVVRSMYHGFDYMRGMAGTPQERLIAMAEAIEWILDRQHKAAERETAEEARKKAHRRYQDEVLALSKAFALAAASDDARQIRDEVGVLPDGPCRTGQVGPGNRKISRRSAIGGSTDHRPRSGLDGDCRYSGGSRLGDA